MVNVYNKTKEVSHFIVIVEVRVTCSAKVVSSQKAAYIQHKFIGAHVDGERRKKKHFLVHST